MANLQFILIEQHFSVLSLHGIPSVCDLRLIIAWVATDHMLDSHTITDQFYRNATQCIFKHPNGTTSTFYYTEPVEFKFT